MTERVSVAGRNSQADGYSSGVAISRDGRYVAFSSTASNLVRGDTNGRNDVFVRDRRARTTTRVSVSGRGVQGDDSSDALAMTPDGRYVAFDSLTSNLVPGDTDGPRSVFVRDRRTGTTRKVAAGSTPAISADGRYVAFNALRRDVEPGEPAEQTEAYLNDRRTGRTTRLSVAADGGPADGWSTPVALSADGGVVSLQSRATNLVVDDTNGSADVFVVPVPSAQPAAGSELN